MQLHRLGIPFVTGVHEIEENFTQKVDIFIVSRFHVPKNATN